MCLKQRDISKHVWNYINTYILTTNESQRPKQEKTKSSTQYVPQLQMVKKTKQKKLTWNPSALEYISWRLACSSVQMTFSSLREQTCRWTWQWQHCVINHHTLNRMEQKEGRRTRGWGVVASRSGEIQEKNVLWINYREARRRVRRKNTAEKVIWINGSIE